MVRPGLFAWNRPDQGSALLLEHMPHLSGDIADFGCGWGALSREILKHPDVTSLTAIDADALAIEAIRKNNDDPRLNAIWGDATQPMDQKFDTIIMNPPFHEGGRADRHDLGAAMIQNGFSHLGQGGQMMIVANAHLPYEKTVTGLEILCEANGFKILNIQKP